MISHHTSKTIMVIDDDPPIARLLQAFLQSKGYLVTTMQQSPLEGFAHILAQKPDLIILDLMFGNQPDGWFAAQRLRGHPDTRETRLVICSAARSRLDDLAATMPIADVKILYKPFDLKLLEAFCVAL